MSACDDGPEATREVAAGTEAVIARRLRARGLVAGWSTPQIAAAIRDECHAFGTTWVRAYRLALGITLADVVEQVRARYEAQGRQPPRFSQTLLSAYESGQKKPGPEYMHYLCAVYGADPPDLGLPGTCFCGHSHRAGPADGTGQPRMSPPVAATGPPPAGRAAPGRPAGAASQSGLLGAPGLAGESESRALSRPAPAGENGGRALTLPDPAGENGAGALTAPGESLPADSAWAEDDDDVLRRALLRLIAGAPVDLDYRFFRAVDRVRQRMDAALFRGSVSAAMLDQWEETAAGYGRQYMTVPPLRLLCDVLLDFGDVRRMCEQRQPIESAERLCRLAAQLAALTGMTMIDIGDQRMARSFFRTARIAADETGDRALRAWVAVREALVPMYYGDPREAVMMARTAAGLAGRTQCVAAVMAPVAEARALGRLTARGSRTAGGRVRAALDRAADGLSALPASQRGDTAFGYTERQFFFHQGDALVALGDLQGAERSFAQSLRLYSPTEFLDRSLVQLGQARCRLEEDEPEEALRVSRDTVLDLPREQRAEIIVSAARALGESVAARHGNVAGVREYREALLTS